MKKLFILLLALVVSVGTIFAERIGGLSYYLDWEDYTAKLDYGNRDRQDLTTVNIPSSVWYDGDNYTVTGFSYQAFARCTNLTSVVIPSSIGYIDEYVFYGCKNLTFISIPSSVARIYSGAFMDCTNLSFLNIPSSVTSIESNAFEHVANVIYSGTASGAPWGARSVNGYVDGSLVYSDNTKTTLLACLSSATGKITIPNSVTSIGDYAFYNCSGLTSIEIPSSVTSIGSSAFKGCFGLKLVEIPSGVTSIGSDAFYNVANVIYSGTASGAPWGAKSMNGYVDGSLLYSDNTKTKLLACLSSATGEITIPNSVTSIDNYAFYNCSGLTSIIVGSSVTSIKANAFDGCSNITTVAWNAKNCNSWNFGSQVETFTLGEEVQTIPNSLCAGMTKLTSIEIPNSITSIGSSAFYNCSGLTSIEIPNSVKSIGSNAFYKCSGLTGELVIPNSVTSIGSSAFSGCSGLTSIEIPDSVASIESYAFGGCSGLTSIEIPNSVTSIGVYAFSGCSGLTSIEIPNSVTSIGVYAFSGCSGLTSIIVGSSVSSIGSNAFNGCSNITTVAWNAKNSNSWYFGSQVETFTFGEEVQTIPNSLCQGMNLLTSITIPNSVTSIGSNAFNGCTGLTSIIVGSSVSSIGSNAFNGCSNITAVAWNAKNCNSWNFGSQVETFTFGDEVETIPDTLCKGMNLLTSVSIPNSVTNIGNRAFKGGSNLTAISVGNNVTNLGLEAFYGCTKITSLTAPAMAFDIAETEWTNYSKQLENIVVNAGELTEDAFGYIARSYKRLRTLDVSATTNTNFADEAFKGYYNLEVLRLPTSLESISYMMAAGCKNLNGITIPALVTSIDQSAFEDCRSITQVTFEEGSQLTQIGNWAFYNCHELATIDIPEGVTEIGNAAFYGCTYLQTAHIPTSVQSIGNNAFALCSKLTQMNVDAVQPPTVEHKTFYEVSTEAPVYVPDESVTKYKSHAIWGKLNIQGQHNTPTAIDQITDEPSPTTTKVICDGQVLILRGDKTYTITGQEVR